MQEVNFEHKEGSGFHITDFPDAEKVIALQNKDAQTLADLALHRSDLIQSEGYLDLSIAAEDKSLAQRAFWQMAIITFTKCFGKNNARANSLDINDVIPNDTMGYEAYNFIKNLRDKNIAHDDNPVAQCLVGAVINKSDAPHKVEKIITMTLHGQMDGEENRNNLRNLIRVTRKYVEMHYDKVCEQITKELEPRTHDDLIKEDSLIYNVPMAADVYKNRKKLK